MTHHEGKLSQLLRTLCNAEELRKEVDTMRRIFLQNVSDEAEQELVTEQIKSIVSCYRAPTAKSDEEETNSIE